MGTSDGMAETPLVSVVIVTYNSRDDLKRCLPSLLSTSLRLEVVVVDNASHDGTAEWVRTEFPQVRLLALDENTWYAGGNNIGIRAAGGDYILILNPDTELKPGALEEMLRVAELHPHSLVTAKLLLPDGSINACGNVMHYTGIAECVGLGRPAQEYHGITHPLLVSGAAILARREIWEDLGGFDETLQMYVEDTDLSLRARLKGYRILCAADAVIIHYYALRMSPQKFRFLERNRLMTILKVYATSTLLRSLPALLLTTLATGAFAVLRGRAYRQAWARSYTDIWKGRGALRRTRARVQQERLVGDRALIASMTIGLPFDQLMENARLAKLLLTLTTPIFRLLRPTSGRSR